MFDTPVISSTFFLTLLLTAGLFFFIKASVKDRTQKVKLISQQPQEVLLSKLQAHFEGRSYQITQLDRANKQVTFEGFVRPSWFLAIFLTLMAVFGALCLALVLAYLYPQASKIFFLLTAIAPLTGLFYWQKAGRLEKVALKVEAIDLPTNNPQTLMTIAAHRDELIQLERAFTFERGDRY